MSDYQQAAPKPKTVLDHRDLSMYAPNGDGKFANGVWSGIKKNQPLITVRTNLASDANNDYGRIQAQVPLDKFYMFLEMLRYAATCPEKGFRWCYEHKDRKFIGPGKMTDGPVVLWRLVVGKEENGVVYWSLVMEKRPNIKFSFLADTKSNFKDGDGNEMPKELESRFLTLGKLRAVEELMPFELRAQYKHPEPKQQGGGGGYGNRGGNGGGYGGGNGGGGQRPAQAPAVDMGGDDIPW